MRFVSFEKDSSEDRISMIKSELHIFHNIV